MSEINWNNISEWTIFIEDGQGELAMNKWEETGGRYIDE